jgi:soluble lytic murein transglycosylase
MSKGKAAYWCAQAAKHVKATKDHRYWLQIAAKHPAHYYGQLAFSTLHHNQFPNPHHLPSLPIKDVQKFSSRKEAQILALLYRANLEKHFKGFLEHLAESLSSYERRLLLNYLQHLAPRYVVFTARKMARFDDMLIKEAFPIDHSIIKSLGRDIDPALIHAVIRQESSFDPYATSPAGAMGLMQLMSGTAKEAAKKLGVKFNQKHLHSQPSFNVRLGQHYLKELLTRFEQSVPISLAAYNAGPGNARKWLTEVGDPRTGEMDIIDWIEALPFGQTRDYVFRVMENYNIYSQLLKPKPSPGVKPHS